MRLATARLDCPRGHFAALTFSKLSSAELSAIKTQRTANLWVQMRPLSEQLWNVIIAHLCTQLPEQRGSFCHCLTDAPEIWCSPPLPIPVRQKAALDIFVVRSFMLSSLLLLVCAFLEASASPMGLSLSPSCTDLMGSSGKHFQDADGRCVITQISMNAVRVASNVKDCEGWEVPGRFHLIMLIILSHSWPYVLGRQGHFSVCPTAWGSSYSQSCLIQQES